MEKPKIDFKATIERHNKTAEIAIELFIQTQDEPLVCWSKAAEMVNLISDKSKQFKKKLEEAQAPEWVKDL